MPAHPPQGIPAGFIWSSKSKQKNFQRRQAKRDKGDNMKVPDTDEDKEVDGNKREFHVP